jgi:uncharacterized damage-inducible protein DinB
MFRTIQDFTEGWAYESEATLKVLRALTDASLEQRVTPAGRTLGRLAWHIIGALAEMPEHSGLPASGPKDSDPQPSLAEMIRHYEAGAKQVAALVNEHWTDAMLTELIPMYGQQWPRGGALSALIAHQTHHRGQMTVLMRQAGLKVPGVYGPAAEEWAAMNMPQMP